MLQRRILFNTSGHPGAPKEYKLLKSDFKETDWAQTVDRFHIQSARNISV